MTGPLFIIIAAFLWAADGVIRRSLFALPPLTIVMYEHLIGLVFLFPVLLSSLRSFWKLKTQDKAWMMWIAVFSSVFGTLWFTTALLAVNFIPFSVVFLLQKLQPIFVILTARLFLREKVGKKFFPWALLALIAAYFVTFPNGIVNLVTGAGTLKAAMYALGAAFAWGTSTVFSRMMLTKLPDKQVTTLRFFFAAVFAFLMIVGQGATHPTLMITLDQASRFVLIALSTGMVALYIYYKGLARTPATIATFLELVFPVTAVLIDAILYKSLLLPSQYVAALLLLFSAYKLSTLEKHRVVIVTKKVKGKGRGKFLGYPTVNMIIPKKLSVQDGIYAARVWIGKKEFKGALHFGPIPTFADEQKSLEVFLLDTKSKDIDSHLRGNTEKIKVEFVKWLRPVINFSSEKELTDQIGKDVVDVRKILE